MHDDRMEWVIPDAWAKAVALARPEYVMTAEVSGEAIIVRRGPTSANAPQRLVDRGSGRLVVILDVW
jgi:hypothetical protein